MIYDTVLNVTWLQDANYAYTSGHAPGGRKTWQEAKQWAENLSYGGFTDWRLPSVRPRNGSYFDYGKGSNETSGLTDLGFNIAGPHSELGYMFYTNLGNTGQYTTSGQVHPDFNPNEVKSGPFLNLMSGFYWTGTPYDYSPDNLPSDPTYCAPPKQCAWDFVIGYGAQTIYPTANAFRAWAVRDGDVVTDLRSLTLKTSEVAGCKSVVGTIALTAPAPSEGLVVTLSDTLASASTLASLKILSGATTKNFTVTTVPVATKETGTISATLGSRTLTRDLTVRSMGMLSVALAPSTVVGSQSVTGKATWT
jgi:hypothetical protein